MSTTTDFDRHARAWLEDGPTQLSDRTLDAALAEIHLTRQRRALRVPWRFPSMTTPMARTVVAAVAFAVAASAGVVFVLRPGGVGGPPEPSPSASHASTSAPAIFSSRAFGYDAQVPAGWTAAAGTTPGTAAQLAIAEAETAPPRLWDHFNPVPNTALGPTILATSTALPPETTEDAWIDAYQAPQLPGNGRECIKARTAWDSITIDGRAGGYYVGCEFVEAMVFVEDRVFIFTYLDLSGSTDPAAIGRLALEAFLESVSLHPERAAPLSPAST
jgi:hypothetical protein